MKYLVNRETKEHKIYNGGPYPEWCDIVEADDEGWIKWEATPESVNPCRNSDTVETKWSDGSTTNASEAWDWNWAKFKGVYMTHYRPILPAESKPVVKQSLTAPATLEETWHKIKKDSKIDVFTRLAEAVAASESIPALIAEINAMLPEGYEVTRK